MGVGIPPVFTKLPSEADALDHNLSLPCLDCITKREIQLVSASKWARPDRSKRKTSTGLLVYAAAAAADLSSLVWVGPLGNGARPRKRTGEVLYSPI